MKVEKTVEFVVSLPNRRGTFAELDTKLTQDGVRIRAFMLYTSFVMNVPDRPLVAGVCKFVADDKDRAREVLGNLGFKFREEDALVLKTPVRTNVLTAVLEKLAKEGLDLVDAYGSLPRGDEDLLIVLSVSDSQKGLEIASKVQ